MATCSSMSGAKFYGASVVDFSATAGWGMQSSEVTINVASDCDETFITPVVGDPKTFWMGKFRFDGIVQSWNSKAGSDANPLHTIKLISPHPILEHTQIILDHYEGEVPFYNMINVYGYLESLGGNCAWKNVGGTMFGAPAGGFGTANKTTRGIPWYLVKGAIEAMSGGGGGGSGKYCKGLAMNGHQYIIDLSSIPMGNKNYRITGPVVSLGDLINQVCEDAGCDFYIQRLYISPGVSGIKVVTISRKSGVGAEGAISAFVAGQNVINKAMGEELRSEVNSTMLIGGKVKQYFQCLNTAGMAPFWGWDAEGNLLKSTKGGDGNLDWSVKLDFRKINLALTNELASFNTVGVNEMRAAMGDYESFEANIINPHNSESVLYKYFVETLKISVLLNPAVRDQADAGMDVKWNADEDDPRGNPPSKAFQDAKTIHNWLSSYASEFYGKQFVVYFSMDSVICRSVDDDTNQVVYSDIISTDGAWPSYGNNMYDALSILGLANPSAASDRFKDDSGKVQAMVKFAGNETNTKGLNNDDFVLDKGFLYIKADVDEKYVDGTPEGGGEDARNIKCALIKLSNAVIDVASDVDSVESNRPIQIFQSTGPLTADPAIVATDEVGAPNNKNIAGQGETVASLGPSYMLDPVGIGVPMESTTTCYGPWRGAGADPGSTNIEVDDGLVPWEYGGFGYMHLAGQAKVEDSFTNQQDADRGEVTVPGLPMLSLANNIGNASVTSAYDSQPQYLSNINNIGGSNSSYYYWSFGINGGAVISNISVSVGAGGVTTTYTVNSFTPVFGRFSKDNAERLKQIGLNKQKNERERRADRALANLLRHSERRSDAARQISADIGIGATAPKSAPVAFAGKIIGGGSVGDPKRPMVIAPTKTTMPLYSKEEADDTSAMTMDGFFRPVQSAAGDAELPKVTENFGTCPETPYTIPTQQTAPPPPVKNHTPLPIYTKFLDFLANPDGALVSDSRAGASDKGHDIAGVARGTAGDEWDGESPGKLLMRSGEGAGYETDYKDDYRFLALRGPLVVHGWGYDINGKPIPNEVDGENAFETDYTDLTDRFATNWLEKSELWPVAPVDLRFDRRRGVWTVPPSFRMYQIEASGDIAPDSVGVGTILEYKDDIVNEDGGTIQDPQIDVYNWSSTIIPSGEKALAYYDSAKCEYWAIPVTSGGALNIGTTGCNAGNDLECRVMKASGCLAIGSGLIGRWYNLSGNEGKGEENPLGPDFLIEGPRIQSGSCAGAGIGEARSFDSITFVSGMQIEQHQEDAGYCAWKVGGPAIIWSGASMDYYCQSSETSYPLPLRNLIIGSGIDLMPVDAGYTEACDWVIKGPRISENVYSCKIEQGGGVGDLIYAQQFKDLIIGSGLMLTQIGCGEFVLESCASGSGGGCASGVTSGIDVVTSVCCSGVNFNVTLQKLNFEKGCLDSVTAGSQTCGA